MFYVQLPLLHPNLFKTMKTLRLITRVGLSVLLLSCSNQRSNEKPSNVNAAALQQTAASLFQALPSEALNPANPITAEKVALGKTLYYDNRLSLNNTESCNTCHNIATYGVDNKPTSPGDNGKPGTRNSPSTFNAALHFLQFWDGRMKDVEEQAGGPVMNPAEMNMPSEQEVMARLSGNKAYVDMFAAAFPTEKEPVTFTNMRFAIAAFERTLITSGNKFDKYVAGDLTALSDAELTGFSTFMETGCIACHMGAVMGGNMFQKYPLFGTHQELTGSTVDDLGKMAFTKNESDKYMFKVPSLRNVAKTWPYLHDGSVKSLDQVIAIMAKAQLNKDLPKEKVSEIAVFLKALTGNVSTESLQPPVAL